MGLTSNCTVSEYLHCAERFSGVQRGNGGSNVWGSGSGEFREPSVFSIYYAKILDKVFLLASNFLFCSSCHVEEYPAVGEHNMFTFPSSFQTQF
jgi:hypothetical protein